MMKYSKLLTMLFSLSLVNFAFANWQALPPLTSVDSNSRVMIAGLVKADNEHHIYVPDQANNAIYKFNAENNTWYGSYYNNYGAYDVAPSGEVLISDAHGNGWDYPPGSFTSQSKLFNPGWAFGIISEPEGSIAYNASRGVWDILATGGLEVHNSLYINTDGDEPATTPIYAPYKIMVEDNSATRNDFLVMIGSNVHFNDADYAYICDDVGDCNTRSPIGLISDDMYPAYPEDLTTLYLADRDTSGNIYIYSDETAGNDIYAIYPETLGFGGSLSNTYNTIALPSGFVMASLVWTKYNNQSELVIGGNLGGKFSYNNKNNTNMVSGGIPDVQICKLSGSVPNMTCTWTDLGNPFESSNAPYAVVGSDTTNGNIYAINNNGTQFYVYSQSNE